MRTESDIQRQKGGNGMLSDIPTRELMKEFVSDAETLIREELRLAKLELRDEARQAARGAGIAGAGGVVLHAGFLTLCACLVLAMAIVMPAWAAALVVGAVVLGIGALMTWSGAQKVKQANLKPNETINTLKEDQQWAKETIRGIQSKIRAST